MHMQPNASENPEPRVDAAAWVGDRPTEVWRFLRYLGCEPQLAEDLTQDTFLRAIQHEIGSREPSAAMSWLRTTARNLFVDELRRQRRRVDLEQLDRLVMAWECEPRPFEDMLEALHDCLATLGERERQALELRYGARQSRRAIGKALGLQLGGVKALLQRARRRLKACIERRNDDA